MSIFFNIIVYLLIIIWSFFSPLALLCLVILLITQIACIITNFASKKNLPIFSYEIKTTEVNKNFKFIVTVSNISGKISFNLFLKNILTEEVEQKKVKLKAKSEKIKIILSINPKCVGRIYISARNIKIYDKFSFTYKRITKAECGYLNSIPIICKDNVSINTFTSENENIKYKNLTAREYSGNREYIFGDNLRHINYKLSHKLQKLYVKEFKSNIDSEICLAIYLNNNNIDTLNKIIEAVSAYSYHLLKNNTIHCLCIFEHGKQESTVLVIDTIPNYLTELELLVNIDIKNSTNNLPKILNTVIAKNIANMVIFTDKRFNVSYNQNFNVRFIEI